MVTVRRPKPKPLTIHTSKPWESNTVKGKPRECSWCPLAHTGTGFCPDYVGKNAKISFLLPFPSTDDVIYLRPLSGGMGHYISNTYITPYFSPDEVILSHVLRCNQPWDRRLKDYGYPLAGVREKAENNCRIYDDKRGVKGNLHDSGLFTFSPNIYLLTFDPHDVRKVGAYHRQILRDMEKARSFVSQGLRPLVAMGAEAAELLAPWIRGNGSVKSWRGTFWEGEWPFTKGKATLGFNV
jgi:hypothetical protein